MIKYIIITLFFSIVAFEAGAQITYTRVPAIARRTIFPQKDGGYAVLINNTFYRFNAQGKIIGEKLLPAVYQDSISNLEQTDDGGFVLMHNRQNIIIKMDGYFNQEWSSILPANATYSNPIEKGSGGYASYGQFSNPLDTGIFFFNLNENGALIDYKRFALQGFVDFFEKKKNNNGFLSVVYGQVFNLDNDGDTLWTKTFVNEGRVRIFQLSQNYVVKTDSAAYKYNEEGDLLWVKQMNQDMVKFEKLFPDFEDGFIIVSDTSNEKELIKLDANAEIVWRYRLENEGVSTWVVPGNGGYYVFNNIPVPYAEVTRLDSTGKKQWAYTIKVIGSNTTTMPPVMTSDFGVAFLLFTQEDNSYSLFKILDSGKNYTNTVSGKVYQDLNENCKYDSTDLPLKYWKVFLEPEGYYTSTDSLGNYKILTDTGFHKISAIVNNPSWEVCSGTGVAQFIVTPSRQAITDQNFGFKSRNCPLLRVSVSAPHLKRCFTTSHKIKYSNEGSTTVNNAIVNVKLPSSIIPLSFSRKFEKINDEYVFNAGSLAPGASGVITIYDSVDCKVSLGTSVCVKASIRPDTICGVASENWDKSSIAVISECNDDAIKFVVINEGMNMGDSSDFRLYADDVIIQSGKFKLAAEGTKVITLEADGRSYRLEADQSKNHPLKSKPRAFSENCGSSKKPSLGFLAEAVQDDEEEGVEICCGKVVGSFDPNDKIYLPMGGRRIYPGQEITYIIRFKNVGTDTAHTVRVVDTLSSNLDCETFSLDIPSHTFSHELFGFDKNIVQWTFKDINLVDSTTNDRGSNGFVQFKIRIKQGLPQGTEVKNRAAIFFDFNEPIITNFATYKIHQDGTIVATMEAIDVSTSQVISVAPNPFSASTHFSIKNGNAPFYFKIINTLGVVVESFSTNEMEYDFSNNHLSRGFYFYQVFSNEKLMGAGKLKVE